MNKNLIKLEYNKIIETLTKYCITYLGVDLVSSLEPSYDQSTVEYVLNQTTEANTFLNKIGAPPLVEIPNIEIALKSLESGITLSPSGLLDIAQILQLSRKLKDYVYSDLECANNFPIMNSNFELLYSNLGLERTIFESIIDENNISDDASKVLSNLRRNRKKLETTIKDKLNSFIHSSTYSKFIMEPIITIRNDRYVIPVKVEYKDSVKGFVHDVSFSGSTVFIEPISIFDMNNQINNIKAEENIEIEKILRNLSTSVSPIVNNLKVNLQTIGIIDFCFAKAKYSNDISGTCPVINNEKFINLMEARHPLIDKNLVVPININLGINFNSLIITGPNTGGKTVTLKTTGLLCLMAYSGLFIPVKEQSSIYVFDNIFADIGDEQSIAESLSTFSSHMLNIIEILNSITSNSLILVDELGSGTDPIQGASLAISILEVFHNSGCLTIATTHYSEIKNFALTTNGFKNASSEFDIENLKPTYKLIIGVPGKSNAFAISKRLGLPSNIIKRAEDFLTTDTVNVEELIKNIYDDKLIIEKEKDEITKNSNQINMLRKSLEKETNTLELKEKELIESAKQKAKEILLDAKQEADDIIKDLNKMYDDISIKTSLKEANSIRNTLNDKIKELSSNVELNTTSSDIISLSNNDIQIGKTVFVPCFNSTAVIVSHPNKSNDVQIQIGNAKMNINITKLAKYNNDINTTTKNQHISFSNYEKSKTVCSEINVIGQTVDEAIFIIDKYIDDCYIANLPTARIVHGKGTGKLRSGIHNFLKSNPHVRSFRLGTFGEGEMGVTIIELK